MRAFASLDRFSGDPTADSWAGRLSPAVSAALVGWMGFHVSALTRASPDRYAVGCDSLDLTFCVSLLWAFLVSELWATSIVRRIPARLRTEGRCIGGPDRHPYEPDSPYHYLSNTFSI